MLTCTCENIVGTYSCENIVRMWAWLVSGDSIWQAFASACAHTDVAQAWKFLNACIRKLNTLAEYTVGTLAERGANGVETGL